MKSLVFLSLVVAALAHWPYPDHDDKYRHSGLAISSRSIALAHEYQWLLFPVNNQFVPNFYLTFPHARTATSNRLGVTYTISLDHLAEITPDLGTFQLVPGSQTQFQEVLWFTEKFERSYDVQSLGEVITMTFEAYTNPAADPTVDYKTSTLVHNVPQDYPAILIMTVYPDSADDIIDFFLWIDSYQFTVSGSQLAVFWKVSSSNGDDFDRSIPLAVEYDVMALEVDPTVIFKMSKPCVHTRGVNTINATRSGPFVNNRRTLTALRTASRAPHQSLIDTAATFDRTSSQLWISAGYVASVIGILPGDVDPQGGCATFGTYTTISVRSARGWQSSSSSSN